MQLKSELTCPQCGFQKIEEMPADSCVFFYECGQCHKIIRPLPGDCCVFCSFGTIKCPPKQSGLENCC